MSEDKSQRGQRSRYKLEIAAKIVSPVRAAVPGRPIFGYCNLWTRCRQSNVAGCTSRITD